MRSCGGRLALLLFVGMVLSTCAGDGPDPGADLSARRLAEEYVDALIDGDGAAISRMTIPGFPAEGSAALTHEQNRLSKSYELMWSEGGFATSLQGVSQDGEAEVTVAVRLELEWYEDEWVVARQEVTQTEAKPIVGA